MHITITSRIKEFDYEYLTRDVNNFLKNQIGVSFSALIHSGIFPDKISMYSWI
jgi:hypothetical protein